LIANPVTARENLAAAREMFRDFVAEYPKIYGNTKVSFNIHNLLHICDYVELYGSVDSFSAYEFENFMQEMKSAVRKPQQIPPQQTVSMRYLVRMNTVNRN
jgi:hypothetical protein